MRRAHGKALPRKQQHFAAAEALRGFEVQAHSEEAPPSALVASWPEAVRSKRVVPLVCNAGLRESGSSFILEVGPQFEPLCESFAASLSLGYFCIALRSPATFELPAGQRYRLQALVAARVGSHLPGWFVVTRLLKESCSGHSGRDRSPQVGTLWACSRVRMISAVAWCHYFFKPPIQTVGWVWTKP